MNLTATQKQQTSREQTACTATEPECGAAEHPVSNNTQPRCGRLARCAVLGSLALSALGRAVIWDARASRAPHHQSPGVKGPFNQGEAELRVYCDGKGSRLPAELNTGHCAVAVRGNAHLPWLVYETGNDYKGELFSGTMEQHFAGSWTPFDKAAIFRTKRLTPAQFDTFTATVDEYWSRNEKRQSWSLFHNCAQFAARVWSLTTGERLSCRYLPFCTPFLLTKAILKQNLHEAATAN